MHFLIKYGLLHLFFVTLLATTCNKKKENVASGAESAQYINPVFEPILADPSVIRSPEDHLFYAYGTEDNWDDGHGRRVVPVLQSQNLVDWKYIGDAFEKKPAWKNAGGIWAPDINRIGNTYYLYYAFSVWSDPNPGIGVATSPTPSGPFEDHGKILDSKEIGVPNSIDPFLFLDEEGIHFLFWGSYSNEPTQGTYAIQLDDTGLKLKEGAKKIKIAAGDFEAVAIHQHDNQFYFLGSKGGCCEGANSSYHVMVARSDNLLGPYLDKGGNSILNRGAGTLLITGNEKFKGPGHTSDIITDKNGDDWILYHGIDADFGKLGNGTTRRMLMLSEVKWKDGWPYVEGGTPVDTATRAPSF